MNPDRENEEFDQRKLRRSVRIKLSLGKLKPNQPLLSNHAIYSGKDIDILWRDDAGQIIDGEDAEAGEDTEGSMQSLGGAVRGRKQRGVSRKLNFGLMPTFPHPSGLSGRGGSAGFSKPRSASSRGGTSSRGESSGRTSAFKVKANKRELLLQLTPSIKFELLQDGKSSWPPHIRALWTSRLSSLLHEEAVIPRQLLSRITALLDTPNKSHAPVKDAYLADIPLPLDMQAVVWHAVRSA